MKYTIDHTETDPIFYVLFRDSKLGEHSQIEFCDVLISDGDVRRYKRSLASKKNHANDSIWKNFIKYTWKIIVEQSLWEYIYTYLYIRVNGSQWHKHLESS